MEQQSLTSERWRQVKGVFQTAIELPTDERNAYLMDACVDAPSLRTEVESLIAAHQEPGSFLDTPAVDLAADSIVDGDGNLLVGKSLGRYQILALVSRGGMGEVYRARDAMLEREVAVKVLPPDFASDQERLQRFEQEARAASALNHPNIITIHEIGQADGAHFIVSEFIEGETLRQRIAKGRISPGAVLDIAIQITGALNAAHEAGIVHRDIKPENIMVRPDGLVKVLDFGLAKLIEPPFSTTFDTNAPTLRFKTAPGTIMGTMAYMSPEQVRGQTLDARTDIFSLGVVLYEMVAGYSPFARETAADVIASILEKEPPPLVRFASDVPETLEWVIRKALSKDREERYQTAKDLLKSIKNGDAFFAPLSTTSESMIGAIKRYWRAAAIILAFLLAVVAVAGYYTGRAKAIDSIAVLPFINADGNPETEYLAHGITEKLINDLSQLSNLKVRPRNSVFRYKNPDLDPQAAGRELEVEAVLTGQMAPRGDEVAISLQLIDVRENRQLWGARYQRRSDELMTLQAEIARQVAERLRPRSSSADRPSPAKQHTDSIEAYRAYFRGRYFWNKRTKEGFEKACEYFNQAIEIDPNYALAYSGLADCHLAMAAYGLSPSNEGFLKAKEAAKKALAIDDTVVEARTTMAYLAWQHEWNWVEAERGFKRAIDLDASYPTAHQWYAVFLSSMARHEDAIAEIRRAQAIDPFSVIIERDAARIFYFARQYDQAIAQSFKAIEMDQGVQRDNYWLRMSYEQKGLYDKAYDETLKTLALRGAHPDTINEFKRVYAASGWMGYWRKHREMVEADPGKKPVSPYFIAGIYARLGDNDQALKWLEKAYDQHNAYLVILKVDPVFDGLRSDRRFSDLQRRIGIWE